LEARAVEATAAVGCDEEIRSLRMKADSLRIQLHRVLRAIEMLEGK
jgi:hypothetical protein